MATYESEIIIPYNPAGVLEPPNTNQTVIITDLGMPGPPGPAGPTGPTGPPGPSASTPDVYSGTWSSFYTAHAFPYLPPVRFIENDSEAVDNSVEYPDASHVSSSFPVPFTGSIIVG